MRRLPTSTKARQVMRHSRYLSATRRPWVVWLMLGVCFLSALAPAVSHALAAQASISARIEICTGTGAQWVDADPSGIPAEATNGPASALVVSHCPFCLQPTDRGAAPPPQLPYLFLVQGGNQERPVWQAFFFPSTDFPTAAPRGPPAKA
jgi:hypothetical protein